MTEKGCSLIISKTKTMVNAKKPGISLILWSIPISTPVKLARSTTKLFKSADQVQTRTSTIGFVFGLQIKEFYSGSDSNRHARKQGILSASCIPIPSPEQMINLTSQCCFLLERVFNSLSEKLFWVKFLWRNFCVKQTNWLRFMLCMIIVM